MNAIRSFAIFVTLLSVGCNYSSSGTYIDDPRAWTWAFDKPRPSDGVTVNRSRYWSSSHFTAEYVWHFDLSLTDEAVAELLSNPDIERVDTAQSVDDLVLERPAWFLPDGESGYTAYRFNKSSSFVMYVNAETGRSFWYAWQL